MSPSEDGVMHGMPGPPTYEGFGEGRQDNLTFDYKQQGTSLVP